MPGALFTNSKVWQPDGSFAEAFSVTDGHFTFVGSNSEAASLLPLYSTSTDLNGKLVMPGLIDGHLHLVKGSLMMKLLDCSKIKNITELKLAVSKYVQENDPKWVIGGNLDFALVLGPVDKTGGNFTDDLCYDRPLYITNYDYHSAICNSKAFEESSLAANLDNYSVEEIARSPEGKPTGLLKEKGMEFIISALPKPSLDERVKAVTDEIKILHSYGITSVSDITLPDDIDVFSELFNRNELKLRINSYIPFDEFSNLAGFLDKTKDMDPDYFTINGFKAYWDGALGSETALFSMNYKGKNHNGYKTEIATSGRIFDLAKKMDSAGNQMIIHAIGDLAVKEVLDLYSKLPNTKKLRHRIEHSQHIKEDDLGRFAEAGVIASVQPLHLKYDARTVFDKLPEQLIANTHNYLNVIKSGGVINFGTDFPIVEVDPFENIRLAVTRITEYGEFTPELCIPLHECIKGYTLNNAYSNHNEQAVGSIQKGKAADFVIMNDDLFEMKPEQISNAKVWKTYLNGDEVYSAAQ